MPNDSLRNAQRLAVRAATSTKESGWGNPTSKQMDRELAQAHLNQAVRSQSGIDKAYGFKKGK